MPPYAYILLGAGWLAWVIPFFLIQRGSGPAQAVDKRARWGILLEMLAYAALWQGKFWTRAPGPWRLAPAAFLLAGAAAFSWTGVHALGKQWRIDAGLNADHQLVVWGPYRLVRHPIYTSMLFLLLGTGLVLTPFWLLASRFGAAFGEEVIERSGSKPHLDLSRAVRQTLREAGLSDERIDVLPHCTACDATKFFSHRRDRGQSGRQLSFVVSAATGL